MYEDFGVCWVIEGGFGRSEAAALSGVGLGVKVFGGVGVGGLVAACSVL